MGVRFAVRLLGAASCLGMLAGCAAIEFSKSPQPVTVVKGPVAPEAEKASPPALERPLPTAPPSENGGPLNVSVEGALVLAMQNNQGLDVQEVNPAIQQTFISEERSVFDPVINANYSHLKDELDRDLLIKAPVTIPDGNGGTQTISLWQPIDTKAKTTTDSGTAGVTEYLPTGTNISVTVDKSRTKLRNGSTNPNLVYGTDTDNEQSDLNLRVTQSLLRGAGLKVNLASLRQAKLAQRMSDYELRAFVEDLASQVERTYWDCVLAKRQIAIFEESLNIAQRQADEVEERIRIGKLAEVERAAAVSEVAQRRSSLIDARSNYDTLRINLLRLLNPSGGSLEPVDLNLTTEPITPEIDLNGVRVSVELARTLRPDLNQARLLVESDELEVVKTKNGLLPQLDVFVALTKTITDTNYPEWYLTSSQAKDSDRYTTEVGAQFSYPIGNRAPRARHERTKLTRTRDLRALANLAQLVEQDVRTAYIELGRAHEQIAATRATRELQEETLAAEMEKFRLDRSTVLLVSQAQRDLLSAQIGEVQAVSAYLQGIVNLYRVEGSLLERRGVDCPGGETVVIEEEPAPGPASVAAAPKPAAQTSEGTKKP